MGNICLNICNVLLYVAQVDTTSAPAKSMIIENVNLFWDCPAPLNPGVAETPVEVNTTVIKESSLNTNSMKVPLLSGLNFRVRSGQLCVIVGRTGSGKTGLMNALIGDLPIDEGTLSVNGTVGYAAQTPWIQNATVRDNILFGSNFDPEWYDTVIEACALRSDFEILRAGDLTEIGEKGINLSGGQKQRIAIARAVYQQNDIYLLDDCLSAVDADVSHHIFSKCIQGLLKDKVVILVTHNVNLAKHADVMVALEAAGKDGIGGHMKFSGDPQSLQGQDILQVHAALVEAQRRTADEAVEKGNELSQTTSSEFGGGVGKQSSTKKTLHEQHDVSSSEQSDIDDDAQVTRKKKKKKKADKLVKKENQETGSVGIAVYLAYLKVTKHHVNLIPLCTLKAMLQAFLNSFLLCVVV